MKTRTKLMAALSVLGLMLFASTPAVSFNPTIPFYVHLMICDGLADAAEGAGDDWVNCWNSAHPIGGGPGNCTDEWDAYQDALNAYNNAGC